MSRGSSRLEVLDRSDNELHTVSFEEDAFLAYTADNYEYERGSVRYVYESMTTPESVFDYEFENRDSTLVKQQEVPGFNPGDYHSERLYAEARDGTPFERRPDARTRANRPAAGVDRRALRRRAA